jgi:hypothetical protein
MSEIVNFSACNGSVNIKIRIGEVDQLSVE